MSDYAVARDPEAGESPVRHLLGTPGRLAVFFWSLAMVLLVPGRLAIWAALLALTGNLLLSARSLRRLARWRWLLFAALVVGPSLLWAGPADSQLLGLGVSTAGLRSGLRMVLRAAALVVAVDGLSSSVSITELAGVVDRLGIPGLGFAIGVAVNLLPELRRSGQTAWHALRMRGGLRRQWWRGLQLLLVTVVANALRRGEEIALVAEARAFSPERAHRPPIQGGVYDRYMALALVAGWLAMVLFG